MEKILNIHLIITIHDQEILIDFEASNKFNKNNHPVTYIFVGNGKTDKLNNIDNLIIARNLNNNIEEYNYLVDFTSWYACIKNNIILNDYVCLLQYDVNISKDFGYQSYKLLIESPNSILGYAPVKMKNRNFTYDNMGYKPLFESIKSVYGLNIKKIFKDNIKLADDKNWPSTNNVAMHRDTLKDFVRWFTPVAFHMGNKKPVGHAFERAIKLYSILSGRQNIYAPDLLKHFQLNSHKTQDFITDNKQIQNLIIPNKDHNNSS